MARTPLVPPAPLVPLVPLVHFPVAQGGRWFVCYQAPGTTTRHVVEDCNSLAAALAACRHHNGGADEALHLHHTPHEVCA